MLGEDFLVAPQLVENATGRAVYLDFADALKRDGEEIVQQKYGNLFQMYEEITAEDP